ncbi:tail-anchored protein insertion receptor WRB-like [Zootermopsis nevadensis]|uniref:tail-anchored protein insertion receptor WRB-like n=1 Tax=Zootermopsis nevadensis TaxID=136037 RepID=UPI000B8E519C|nr:tail-anchored protein insertion receptor WRB-like [Zootermopsis nevadensis]
MVLLILTTAISFIWAFNPIIIKHVLSLLCMELQQERILQNEILVLQREMACISIIDEFAKHARLQRKLNKVQEELKSRANERMCLLVKLQFVITYVAQAIMQLVMLFLVWNYKYTPVIIIPEKWLHPTNSIFSWPTDTFGGISITIWLIITGTVARMAASSFKF